MYCIDEIGITNVNKVKSKPFLRSYSFFIHDVDFSEMVKSASVVYKIHGCATEINVFMSAPQFVDDRGFLDSNICCDVGRESLPLSLLRLEILRLFRSHLVSLRTHKISYILQASLTTIC